MKKKHLTQYPKQVACSRSNRDSAQDVLDYMFNGQGYIFWFGSYWAVYSFAGK